MIDEILLNYKTFSDSIINRIEYFQKEDNNGIGKICKVYMFSYNWAEDKFENIILQFENIKDFRFIERENMSSMSVTDALLEYDNNVVIFDFFPKQYSDSILGVDPQSDFLMRCEKVYLSKESNLT